MRDLTNQTDGLTVTQVHVSPMLCTIWSSLRRMFWSTSNPLQSKAHRSGMPPLPRSFRADVEPPLFGLGPAWHAGSQTNLVLHVCSKGRACLSLFSLPCFSRAAAFFFFLKK